MPHGEVVAAFEAGQRVVGDFIARVPRAGQRRLRLGQRIERFVVRRHLHAPGADVRRERRPLLHRQRIYREMSRFERDRLLERTPEGRAAAAGNSGDEVERHVVEARVAECGRRRERVGHRVPAPEEAKRGGVERLRAEAHASDARGAQRLGERGVDLGGVEFDRELRAVRQRGQRGGQRAQTVGAEARRRASAEIERRRARPRRAQRAFAADQPGKGGEGFGRRPGFRVEGAVAALRDAEGHVDVEVHCGWSATDRSTTA